MGLKRAEAAVEVSTLRSVGVVLVSVVVVLASIGFVIATSVPASASTGAATWVLDSGPADLGFSQVSTISCPDSNYCIALDSNEYATSSLIFNDGEWSTAPLVEPGGSLQLNGVSCASESFCMADGALSSGVGVGVGVIEEWNGTDWSIVSNPESSGTHVDLSGISCPSATMCVAVGADSNGGVVESWDGTAWTMAMSQVADTTFASVSCSSPTSCVAVGNNDNSLTSLVLNGGTWSTQSAVTPGTVASNFLYGVSCASASFCVAVGSDQPPGLGWGVTLTEIWDGTTWSISPSPNLPANGLGAGDAGGGILLGVSCVSPQACIAVGYGGGGENSSGLGYPVLAIVETWDGSNWSLTPTPAPIEPVGVSGAADLWGVSCVPISGDASCVTVGYQSASNGNDTALIMEASQAIGSLSPTSTVLTPDGSGSVTVTVSPGGEEASQLLASPLARESVEEATTETLQGNVTILDNGLPISSCPPTAIDASDQVSCSGLDTSSGVFTADYSGDASDDGSAWPPPTISGPDAVTFTVGVAGSFAWSATGSATPTFSETGALPSGVTFSGGTLSGTPASGTGGTYPITVTASNGISPNATESVTLTVDSTPMITSSSSVDFVTGSEQTFMVQSTGTPTPALSESGTLPSGITFVDNGNGTATLSGTTAFGSEGSYPITITANNEIGTPATQSFMLTVNPPTNAPPPSGVPSGVAAVPKLSLSTTRAQISAKGIEIKLDCGAAASCHGSGTVSAAVTLKEGAKTFATHETIAKANFSLAGDQTATVVFHFTKLGAALAKVLLAHRKRQYAMRLVTTVTGGSRSVHQVFVL